MTRNWRLPLACATAGLAVGIVMTLFGATLVAPDDPDRIEEDTIVILTGRDDSIGGQRQRLIDDWNRLYPDSQAHLVELSGLADSQRSEMLARAQAGQDVDVFNLDVTWIAEFAEAGYIRSLDESRIRTDGFLDNPLTTCRYAGRLWALPFNTDVGLLYYRSDLIEKPPRQWDELEQQVKEVRGRTGNRVDGYAGQFADYEGLTVTAWEVIHGVVGPLVDEDGELVVADWQMPLVNAGLRRLGDIAPSGVPEFDEDSAIQAFQTGDTLFMRNWPRAHRALAAGLEGSTSVPFGVALLPGNTGMLGGQNLAISASSKRPRAAQALIEFLTSDRSQQLLFERGGLPATRKVVYHDPVVREQYPSYVDTLKMAIEQADLRPIQPHYARVSQTLRSAVDDYLRQEIPLPDDFPSRLADASKGFLIPADE
jgi:multiple sugar transport system substrate-binding protein